MKLRKDLFMLFQDYLEAQLKLHPSIQPQDIVKMCYQAAFGAEHLLEDTYQAWNYFLSEYQSVQATSGTLYEELSSSICRINLAVWKSENLPAIWLFRMFVASAKIHADIDAATSFEHFLQTATALIRESLFSFSSQEWEEYLTEYKKTVYHAVHHSELYRQVEKPAYRIINKRFLRLLPILKRAASLIQKNTIVISIDGRAASGKSTIAEILKEILDAELIHMDDFFLPPAHRTPERFAEPGGNVHYERFYEEVVLPLTQGDSFSYRIFDCSKMDYNGLHEIHQKKWIIIEGSYSCHPHFGDYADLKIFSDVDPKIQMERIKKRNGEFMAKRFQNEWIPMEEVYFNHFQIKKNSDLII